MKNRRLLNLVILLTVVTGCSSGEDGLPSIVVGKDYPVKELIITDFADVIYVCPDSDNPDWLYGYGSRYVTKNRVVVADYTLGNILFFSKEGKPISRFNHQGRGPEEYLNIDEVIYDEIADEVYVTEFPSVEHIHVYSSTGEYKRKILIHGVKVKSIRIFDEQSLFIHDDQYYWSKYLKHSNLPLNQNKYDSLSPFIIVSKTDGEILDYIKIPQSELFLATKHPDGSNTMMLFTCAVNCSDGLLLCNPETDTVYHYSNKKILTPVFCKTPPVESSDPMTILNNIIDVGKYQFMDLITLTRGEDRRNPTKYYFRDKQTGEIFQQKLVLPDYAGKEFFLSPYSTRNHIPFVLSIVELKQAYAENKLSGKLKELVASLDDEDNDVFVFLDFKK